MMIQATPNVTSNFKALAYNGKMDLRVTANVLSLMPLSEECGDYPCSENNSGETAMVAARKNNKIEIKASKSRTET